MNGAGTSSDGTDDVGRVFRREYGRAVASLARVFGDITVAEDAVQEAFVEAVRRWPVEGLPPSPAGWIITTARNRGLDRVRREAKRDGKQSAAQGLWSRPEPAVEAEVLARLERVEDVITDDRLRLLFTCCHPALTMEARVALTLRLLGGLETSEIARAFLVQESTMAQRIVRAKSKITKARVPYRVPTGAELPVRLGGVLAVLYLIFNEGYLAGAGSELVRDDLAAEAVRLGRTLVELMPDEPEAVGLLALMLLAQSRRAARVTADGSFVPLDEQDRSTWDTALIMEGQSLVRACLRRHRPGPYQVQAAIQAVHSDAADVASTDWCQVLALYDQLMIITPGPVVALNRVVALAEVEGPSVALAAVEAVDLAGRHLFHAIRADLLRRLGRRGEALAAYEQAIGLADNRAERDHLRRRLVVLGSSES